MRTISNSVSVVVGFSEDQKGGREKHVSVNQGDTIMSPDSKATWKRVLTDSGFYQE